MKLELYKIRCSRCGKVVEESSFGPAYTPIPVLCSSCKKELEKQKKKS